LWEALKIILNNSISLRLNAIYKLIPNTTKVINNGSRMIEPNEESIKQYVDEVCTYMHGNTKNKVIKNVIRLLKKTGQKVQQDFVTYTAQDVIDFIKGENLDIVVGGNFDHKRKEFGWSVLEGYPHEFVLNAAKKYAETGSKSYFTFHTYRPLDNQTVEDKREKMRTHLSSVEESMVKAVEYYQKNGVFPWRVNGYLPQDVANKEKSYIVA
jgi:adenylate kinase family enzyme